MYIIQTSDMHIGKLTNLSDLYKKLDSFMNESKKIIKNNTEYVVFCILGDVVEQGDKEALEKVDLVISRIQNFYTEYSNFKICFVPGNHDIISYEEEVSTASVVQFLCEKGVICSKKSIHSEDIYGTTFVFINSSYHCDYTFGKVDSDLLCNIENDKNKIMLMHHSFFSSDNDDSSPVRSSYKIISYIEKNHVCAVLHGHTHGYKDITIGKECKIIGSGPIFKSVKGVNNQINIIEHDVNGVKSIQRIFYHGDTESCSKVNEYNRDDNAINVFNSVYDAYNGIITKVNNGIAYNCIIRILTNISLFEDDVNSKFGEEVVKDAKEWQNPSTEEFRYNHAELMRNEKISGVQFVIDELKNKATSSRAIIPLINFNDVVKSKNGYLPSFDLLQFGFSNEKKDELYVNLYMRALELKNFFKINICELYLIIKQIYKEIISIERLNITIIPFRSQIIKKFSCFRKLEIDKATEASITQCFLENKDKLSKMILDKSDYDETIYEHNWLDKIENAVSTKQDVSCYGKIIDIVNELKLFYKDLTKITERTSEYSKVNDMNIKIKNKIKELAESIKNGG